MFVVLCMSFVSYMYRSFHYLNLSKQSYNGHYHLLPQIRLYSADENHEEFLFLACRFLVHSFGLGLGSELEQFQLKMKDMNPILRELNWLLAVEMFSADVYCRVIKTLFTDNRGLGPNSKTSPMYAVELGFLFLDQSIYKNLDMKGKIVNRRLMDLLSFSSSFGYVSEADVDEEKQGPTSVVKDCVMAAIDERDEVSSCSICFIFILYSIAYAFLSLLQVEASRLFPRSR